MTQESTLDGELLQAVLGGSERMPRQRHVGRLLRLRSSARQSEADGKQAAADFFWTEAHRELLWLVRHSQKWRSFIAAFPAQPDAPGRGDTDLLLHKFIGEAFVDTHLAFYEAWQNKSAERAWTHLDYARRLIDLSAFAPEDKRRRIGPRTKLEIQSRQKLGQWSTALMLAADLLQRFPESAEYLDIWCEARVKAALAQLQKNDKPRHRAHNARTLASGLYELKRLRLDRPHHVSLFLGVARLHAARAETLDASGLLAEALVEAEASLAYSPGIPGGGELRSRIEADLQRLRVEAALPESERPALTSRQARARLQQAAKGFRLVDAFRKSDEARAAADDLPVAQGRATWESIGLPPLEPIDHRPLALEDAIQTILNAPPADPAELPSEWQRVSQDNPHLRELDAGRVRLYIAHRLFGHEFSPEPADLPSYPVPAAPLRVSAPTKGSEPFWLWLFSPRNLRLKTQMVAAAMLAVCTLVAGTAEFRARSARAQAYGALRQARMEARFDAMLDAAESFLAQRLLGRDDRVAEVEALYSEALVRWFNATGPAPAAVERRLARYRQLLLTGQ